MIKAGLENIIRIGMCAPTTYDRRWKFDPSPISLRHYEWTLCGRMHLGRRSTKTQPKASVVLCGGDGACQRGQAGLRVDIVGLAKWRYFGARLQVVGLLNK